MKMVWLLLAVVAVGCGSASGGSGAPFTETIGYSGQPFVLDQDTHFVAETIVDGPAIEVSNYTWSVSAPVGATILFQADNQTLTVHPVDPGCYSVQVTVRAGGDEVASDPVSGCT